MSLVWQLKRHSMHVRRRSGRRCRRRQRQRRRRPSHVGACVYKTHVKKPWKTFLFEWRPPLWKKMSHSHNIVRHLQHQRRRVGWPGAFASGWSGHKRNESSNINLLLMIRKKEDWAPTGIAPKATGWTQTNLVFARGHWTSYRLKNGVGGVAIVDKREFNERLPVMKRSSFDSARP